MPVSIFSVGLPRISAALEARGDKALDAYSRQVLADILGRIDDPRAVAALKKAAKDDPDEAVRRAAGEALKDSRENADPGP
jgi:HEAT repeat protein